MISLIHSHTCGFARAAALGFARAVTANITRDENITPKQNQQRVVHQTYTRFSNMFVGTTFSIGLQTFKQNYRRCARNSALGILARQKNVYNIQKYSVPRIGKSYQQYERPNTA